MTSNGGRTRPVRLEAIHTKQVESMLNSIGSTTGIGPKSLNNILGLLKKIFNDACRWGYLRDNPARYVKPFQVLPREDAFLTPDEVERLLNHVQTESPLEALCYRFAIVTGMRAGEIRGLQWTCVDLKKGVVTVKQVYCAKTNRVIPRTKSNRIRWQILTPVLRCELENMKRGNGFVFEGFDWHHASRNLRSHCQQAGVPEVRFHDLRHTSASIMVSKGVELYTVQKHLGHSSPMMTQRYAHLAQPAQVEATLKSFDI